jgi:hypothetical protein
MKFFWWRAKALDTTIKTKCQRKDDNQIFYKYKQIATNVVFPRISSIFDPQDIFSVELLPGGGQAHHMMDCILTTTFIGSRCRIRGARQHPAKQST